MVLVYWCSCLTYVDYNDQRKAWDVLDFFCGQAKISKHTIILGYRAAAYDINLAPPKKKRRSIWRPSPSPMDFNSDVGFAPPSQNKYILVTLSMKFLSFLMTITLNSPKP